MTLTPLLFKHWLSRAINHTMFKSVNSIAGNYINDVTIGTCCIPLSGVQTIHEWCKVCKL